MNRSAHPYTSPVAVVTGAGSGIGAACSRALAAQGYRVGIHYRRNAEGANRVLREIDGKGFLLQADLALPQEIDTLVRQIKEETRQVDVLVNNAGFAVNTVMAAMAPEAFEDQRSLSRGAWYLTKSILRRFMLRRNQGRIINISSVVGHTGNAGQVAYAMEKAAIDAMTKSLAKELQGRPILVNSVAPGFIDTDMTRQLPDEVQSGILQKIPLGRMGKAEEVAEVVSFLAHSGAYIQGSILHVNGGMYSG